MDTTSLICIAIGIFLIGIFSGCGIGRFLFSTRINNLISIIEDKDNQILSKNKEIAHLYYCLTFLKIVLSSTPKAFIHHRIRTRFDVKDDRVTTRLRLSEDKARKTYEGEIVFQLGDSDTYVKLKDIQSLSIDTILKSKIFDSLEKTITEL